jgi:hypothetical protein
LQARAQLQSHNPWLPLSDAADLCWQAGVWHAPFEDILKSGRVPLRGRRRGHFRADPFEHLLSQVESVSILPLLNEITLRLDPSEREIAETLAGSSVLLPSDWTVTFREVRVHWLKLADELAAAGFATPDRAGSKRRLAYKGELVSFMRRLQRSGLLGDLTDDDVAQRFADDVASKVQAGRSVLKLPQCRNVANQVGKLRPKILS